jgi:hypothetical protein
MDILLLSNNKLLLQEESTRMLVSEADIKIG